MRDQLAALRTCAHTRHTPHHPAPLHYTQSSSLKNPSLSFPWICYLHHAAPLVVDLGRRRPGCHARSCRTRAHVHRGRTAVSLKIVSCRLYCRPASVPGLARESWCVPCGRSFDSPRSLHCNAARLCPSSSRLHDDLCVGCAPTLYQPGLMSSSILPLALLGKRIGTFLPVHHHVPR